MITMIEIIKIRITTIPMKINNNNKMIIITATITIKGGNIYKN